MASRFPQRQDPRSALFENYHPPSSINERKARASPAPRAPAGGYGLGLGGGYGESSSAGGGYRENGNGNGNGFGGDGLMGGYRPATPNRKGQYSDAVLESLESQNDSQVEGIMGKVKQLKSMTVAIGDEIRSSTALAEKMNEGFDGTRLRLRGTMNRMLVMAQKTGVGWKVWLLFFAAVGALFFWVWAFR